MGQNAPCRYQVAPGSGSKEPCCVHCVPPPILAVKGVWKMEISGMISANKLSRACQGFVIDRLRPNAQDSCISLPIPPLPSRTATSLGLAAVSARVLATRYAVKPGVVTQVVVPVPGNLIAARDHILCAQQQNKIKRSTRSRGTVEYRYAALTTEYRPPRTTDSRSWSVKPLFLPAHGVLGPNPLSRQRHNLRRAATRSQFVPEYG